MIVLLGQRIRRDRIQLLVWVLAISGLTAASVAAVGGQYGDATSRRGVLQVALSTPALLALRGEPNGASLGSIVFFQLFGFLAVAVGVMNSFLATRHGRGDEERGRRELIMAAPIGRSTDVGSTIVLAVVLNAVLAAALAGGLSAAGLSGNGPWVMSAAVGGTGLAFFGVALLIGELAPTSRAANSAALVVVLGSYAVRGAGDALGTPDVVRLTLTPAWPIWASPIGWGEQTLALTANRTAPLLLSIALFAVSTALAVAVHTRRDLSASLVAQRAGRASASPALAGAFGLAWRLNRTSLIGWTVGGALLGAVIGPLASAVRHVISRDPGVVRVLSSLGNPGGGAVTVFVAAILAIVGIVAAAAGAHAALSLREEETAGHAELLLATPLSRRRWVVAVVTTGWITAGAILAATALCAAIGLAAEVSRADAERAVALAAVQLPAALVFVGLAVVLCALLPRASVPGLWGLFAIAAALGLFGLLLRLPTGVRDISPFSVVPAVPVHDWVPTAVLVAIDLLLPLAAIVALRRRDVPQ